MIAVDSSENQRARCIDFTSLDKADRYTSLATVWNPTNCLILKTGSGYSRTRP